MKASNIKDIIALLPAMLGAPPSECINMVLVKDGTVFGAMSGPLPDSGDNAVALLEQFVEQAEGTGSDIAFLIINTTITGEQAEAAYAMFALGFDAMTLLRNIKVEGSALVTDQFWVDYDKPEVKRDLAELKDSTLAAQLVSAGVNLSPAPKSLPEPDKASMSLTLRALGFRATLPKMMWEALTGQDTALLLTAWERWTNVLDTEGDMSEREAADLIGYFQHVLFRDLFFMSLSGDEPDLNAFTGTLTRLIDNPDPAWLPRAKRASVALRELLRWTESAQRPNMLAMLGFCEWFMGHGQAAAAAYDAAKAIDPDHSLTSLFDQLARRKGLAKSITHPDAAQYASIING